VDSLSQIALGAAVGMAAMGRRTALWKAALWGGIAGTLPDLDVLIDHGDALRNMVMHRGWSHSLFWLTLASPLLAALPAAVHGERALFSRWWLAMWLALVTHPLLDAMTVYGTRLLLPFSDHPFAVGSIFIIDPLYTVPLLVGVVLAVTRSDGRRLGWNRLGLLLSTGYLAWSAGAQAYVRDVAQDALGSPPAALLVTPSPFNTVLWRVVAMREEGSYQEGHRSLFDAHPFRTRHFEVSPELRVALAGIDGVRLLGQFSQGFYKLHARDGQAWITDLRMGQEPYYTFSFLLAQRHAGGWAPVLPVNQGSRGDLGNAFSWLWQRLRGLDVAPPA
jgi:inner membrane protein